ncbi:putative F-box protein [Cinnamomum micranthum f. kanehirae]|uniref:Putative F-box protein n=1 Tax=Cinnamomum micranthum f. kanehirae TaxID=337451 RepID=A0A3S3M7U8_9MAGN|nr:putative F-box protein [Cinnamomum micranthum f. kanehirae]
MRGDHKNVRVDVEAPNLEILNIYSEKLGNYSFKDMPFLREAYIEVSHPRCSISVLHSSLESLLQSLSRVRVFKLSSACILALSLRALQNLPALIFKHKHLILETGLTIWELKGIAYLMKNSPDLETLVMKLSAQNAYYDLNTTLATKLNFNETEHWESFLSPFSCVVLHLKTIEIWDSAGEVYLTLRESSTSDVSETSLGSQGNGIRLLRLCLERAMCLEKLTLYINKIDFKAMQEIAQIIRAFPRASSSAVVLVCKYEVKL